MNTIRAKFYVTNITPTEGHEAVSLSAVVGDGSASDENKSFSAATPWGDLTIGISNPAVIGFFKQGKEYYLDISPAEPLAVLGTPEGTEAMLERGTLG